jgi:hypothetical protein
MAEPNPVMLTSEHKRILASAYEKSDAVRRACIASEHKRGFWRGVASTIWLTGIMAYVIGLSAFTAGLYMK